jgi:hypothetical protein
LRVARRRTTITRGGGPASPRRSAARRSSPRGRGIGPAGVAAAGGALALTALFSAIAAALYPDVWGKVSLHALLTAVWP